MRIERIKINGFGLFSRGITVEFGDAPIAVVVGDNESGKTTMMEAIVATIFGFTKQKNEEARRPWQEHESYSCSVTLRLSNSSLIEIARDFDDNAVRMRQLTGETETDLFLGKASSRSKSPDAEQYSQLLEGILGFGEVMLFMASVFVRQEQLMTELSEKMRRVVSGSVSTDYEKAQAALREKFFKLTKRNPWGSRDKKNDRRIEELRARKDEVTGKLDAQREAEHTIEKLLEQQQQLKEEIERLKRQIDENENALQSVAQFNRLNGEKDRARERETTLRRELENVRETRARIEKITGELKEKYPDFDSADMPFQQQLARAGELEDELVRREQALRLEKGRWEMARRNEKKVFGLIFAIIMSVVGAVVGFATGGAKGCLTGIVVGGALGYLLSRFIQLPGGRAARAQARVSMVQEELKDIRERRERLNGEIKTLCGTSDIAAISVQFEEYRALQNQLSAAKSLSESFRAEQDIRDDYDEAVQELAVIETQIEQLLRTATSLSRLKDDLQDALVLETRLRASCEEMTTKLEEEREREIQLKLEIARSSGAQVNDRPLLEEQIEDIECELARLALSRDALKCAVDVLSEAIAEYRKGYLPMLEDEITELFSRIVGERYSRIHFDKNLGPRVDGPARSDIDPAALSVGTRDQLYLAMRLAFARQISHGETLPLILDDPFANFDEQRLAAVHQILKSVSKDQQIILFTHDRRFASWGDLLVELGEANSQQGANCI